MFSRCSLLVPRQIMRAAMKLRAALVPYFYSQARVAYETGLSIVHPVRALLLVLLLCLAPASRPHCSLLHKRAFLPTVGVL